MGLRRLEFGFLHPCQEVHNHLPLTLSSCILMHISGRQCLESIIQHSVFHVDSSACWELSYLIFVIVCVALQGRSRQILHENQSHFWVHSTDFLTDVSHNIQKSVISKESISCLIYLNGVVMLLFY